MMVEPKGVSPPDGLRAFGVTPREAEVLGFLALRLRNREIAGRLSISVRTVESHVSALLRKFGVEDRLDLAEAAARWPTAGLAPGPSGPPVPPDELLGREADVAALVSTLERSRLITVTGVGGVGKSRLALAAVEERRDAWPVWWCELGSATGRADVVPGVATALGIHDRSESADPDRLARSLADRPGLLVLDGCEHVREPVVRLVDRLVRRCPTVRVLATSRHVLGLPFEQRYDVQPLAVPAVVDEQFAQLPAVRLFVRHARRVQPGWAVTPATARPLRAVIERLDGLPLALQVVAARLQAATIEELAAELTAPSGVPVAVAARDTATLALQATLDRSYRLLDGPDRQLLARLSVFAGAFDAATVGTVCLDGAGPAVARSRLARLVERSLLVMEPARATARFRLLETVRAYTQERLLSAGERPALQRRHAAWVMALTRESANMLRGPQEGEAVAALTANWAEVRAAVRWALAGTATDAALAIAAAVPDYAYLRTGFEAAGWGAEALEQPGADQHPAGPAVQAAIARAAWNRGDLARAAGLARTAAARLTAEQARDLARCGHPGDVLADIALARGQVEPARRHFRAEATARAPDGRLAWLHAYLAVCAVAAGRPSDGAVDADLAVVTAGRAGNPTVRSMALYARGLVERMRDPTLATALFDEAAAVAASVHNEWFESLSRMEAAAVRAHHEDPVLVAAEFREVLERWHRVGDRTQTWRALRYVLRFLLRLEIWSVALELDTALDTVGPGSPLRTAGRAELLRSVTDRQRTAAVARGTGTDLDEVVVTVRRQLGLLAAGPAGGCGQSGPDSV